MLNRLLFSSNSVNTHKYEYRYKIVYTVAGWTKERFLTSIGQTIQRIYTYKRAFVNYPFTKTKCPGAGRTRVIIFLALLDIQDVQ